MIVAAFGTALFLVPAAWCPRAMAQTASPGAGPAADPAAADGAATVDAATALARTRALVRPSRGGGCSDPLPGEIQVCARRNTARLTEAERAVAGIGDGTDDGLTRAGDASLGAGPRALSGPFTDSQLPPNWQSIGGVINRAVTPNAAFDQLQRATGDAAKDAPPATASRSPR